MVIGGLSSSRRGVGLASVSILVGALALHGLVSASAADVPFAEQAKKDSKRATTWTAPADSTTDRAALAQGVAPTSANLGFVAFATGCRILDSRVGQPFAANEARDLGVLDEDLPSTLGPCGVPKRAVAVQLSLSTVGGSPAANGYARVGPGGVPPTATVLQYLQGQGTSVTTTAPLSPTSKFRLFTLASSHFVVDLLGYWEAPVWGWVDADGILVDGSGVSQIEKGSASLGDYYVTFDRNIYPGCTAVFSPLDPDGTASTRVVGSPVDANTWLFDVRANGTAEEMDGSFSFIVECRTGS